MDAEIAILYFLIFLLFVMIIFMIVSKIRNMIKNIKKGLLATKKLVCVNGLDITNVVYNVELYTTHLVFNHQNRITKLLLEKIENVAMQSESEIVNVSKGVITRGIVGGALLGQ